MGLPSRTSVGPALTASVTEAQSFGSGMRTVICAPTGSAAKGRAAVPRATITAPSAGTSVLAPLPTDAIVPTRSVRGLADGNGSSSTVTPFLTAGGATPHTPLKTPPGVVRARPLQHG